MSSQIFAISKLNRLKGLPTKNERLLLDVQLCTSFFVLFARTISTTTDFQRRAESHSDRYVWHGAFSDIRFQGCGQIWKPPWNRSSKPLSPLLFSFFPLSACFENEAMNTHRLKTRFRSRSIKKSNAISRGVCTHVDFPDKTRVRSSIWSRSDLSYLHSTTASRMLPLCACTYICTYIRTVHQLYLSLLSISYDVVRARRVDVW